MEQEEVEEVEADAARRANRTVILLSVLVALERLAVTGLWCLLLAFSTQQVWESGQAPAPVIPVDHPGQGPDAPADPRPFLWWQALVAAGSLAITLLYLWSFYGMVRRVAWRFVIGIQAVVLATRLLRLVAVVVAIAWTIRLHDVVFIGHGPFMLDPIGAVAGSAATTLCSLVIIALLSRPVVKRLYGVGSQGRRRPRQAASD